MRDRHPDCCPVLRFAAEAERMLELGVSFEYDSRTAHYIIGRLREEYGCPGPSRRAWSCPWMQFGTPHTSVDARVPKIGPDRDDGRRTPGAML